MSTSNVNKDNQYDIIFIGSGMGTLAAASLLAQTRKARILILERHFKLGGYTHTFKRERKFKWDVGVHYIGDVGPNGKLGKMFDKITKGKLKWNRMVEPFEKFVYPDFTFAQYGDPKKFQADLIKQFPDEASAIKGHFRDIKRATAWFERHTAGKVMKQRFGFGDFMTWFGKDWSQITVQEYLDENFKSEQLKAVVCSQWGDYGLPPKHASFLVHAMVVNHYLHGGYFPKGGSDQFLETTLPIVEEFGGKGLVNHEVVEIKVKDGKATGVVARYTKSKTEDLREFSAPIIISDAGLLNTYGKLIPKEYAGDTAERIKNFWEKAPKTTSVSLHLGLKDDPRKLGFQGENHWIYTGYDHNANFENRNNVMSSDRADIAYLSFASLKDPDVSEGISAEIVSFVDYDNFVKWRDNKWKKRGEDYEALKDQMTESLLNAVEYHYPGFKDMIEFKELATPLTNEFFAGHPGGAIYGLPVTQERYDAKTNPWFDVMTPLKGLYITGSDVISPGIGGALFGGVICSLAVLPIHKWPGILARL